MSSTKIMKIYIMCLFFCVMDSMPTNFRVTPEIQQLWSQVKIARNTWINVLHSYSVSYFKFLSQWKSTLIYLM